MNLDLNDAGFCARGPVGSNSLAGDNMQQVI
jgi:hypothetical protein